MENIDKDERFAHIAKDPRFRRLPKAQRKVKIEKRFQGMFNDDRFKVKYSVDKRGRPVQHSSNEDLKRFYELSSEDDSDSEEKDSNDEEEQTKTQDEKEPQDEPGKFVKAPKPDKLDKNIKKKLHDLTVDYARGEGNLLSESSSSSDETSEDEGHETDDEHITHDWGELDKDAETTEDATNRLAACNMDWDRIRAVDLMVLFSSFLPPGGLIKSITIYPSEFGMKRMKEEEVNGPLELVSHKEKIDLEEKNDHEESDQEENEEGSKYHMEKLRQYQLNRLKYYYAVIECDSTKTANTLYTECDGREYESSSTKLDLRFIPDDMTFDQEAKEVCRELPDLSKYEPRYFTTTALQQAKVNLTWDETNPTRIELAQKLQTGKIDDISEADLQDYLASSSGDDENQSDVEVDIQSDQETEACTKSGIDKYKALLLDIEKNEEEKKNRDVEMEITWGVDLKEKTEKLVKDKRNRDGETELTPFEKYLEKRKEKRKAKKKLKETKSDEDLVSDDDDVPDGIDMNDPYFAEEFKNGDFKPKSKKKIVKERDRETDEEENTAELELLLMNEKESDRKHFNMKKIEKRENKTKKKKKAKNTVDDVEDDFELDVTDERFVMPIVKSHHFNIDPADPAFRRTKGMEKLIGEKMKRRATEFDETTEPESKIKRNQENRKNTELNMLIKSVKRKNEAFKRKK